MIKDLLLLCFLLFIMTFCNPPGKEVANGEGISSPEPVEFQKVSNQFNDTTDQTLPQVGIASYYANHFHNKLTASGEKYDTAHFTAAHPTLPFGTEVKVTNLRNEKTVTVTINDRGPHIKNRVIDLSRAAARKLGFIKRGTTQVRIEKAE